MRIERAADSDPVGDPDLGPMYRVRVWKRPSSAAMGWMVDEWDVAGAEQVSDVIGWAATTAGPGPFEVFIQWHDHHTDRNGNVVQYPRYVRVQGRPPEDAGVTVDSVIFETD
ncbi:hypothetical protein [Pseudarthrobacter sp. BRE9]|uniref:hypothetical protein n=1 Tax=Pseudarthrobacter sp. BRE9 TaxID=2962582 RepID=UPI002882AAC6|nr:hypothetical protein [Pseudarthrobacter sp. BRE9]MDT0168885.1 hypothetical protein [Pseudarthrobacter sp. BRE9]